MVSQSDDGVRTGVGRMTPNEFRAEVKRKGWSFVKLGEHWGMSANWLIKVAGRVDRPRYWDDAVRGLPERVPSNGEQGD